MTPSPTNKKEEKPPRKSLKQFARNFLFEQGVDIDQVNLKTDGIRVESFRLLIEKVYDLGYLDGLEQRNQLKEKDIHQTVESIALKKHQKRGFLLANMEKK